jgi:cytochrome b
MKPDARTQVRVWDPAVRLFHWTLAGAFLVAYLTEDELQAVHLNAGYLIGALILFRLVWGFVGPRHARFGDFVRPPAQVLDYLRRATRFEAPRHLGHNPAGGAMILALLVSLSVTVLSGVALYGTTDFAGPLAGVFRGELAADVLEGVHEVGANLTLILIGLHLAGVLVSSLEHGENLVRSMFTGRKKTEATP